MRPLGKNLSKRHQQHNGTIIDLVGVKRYRMGGCAKHRADLGFKIKPIADAAMVGYGGAQRLK